MAHLPRRQHCAESIYSLECRFSLFLLVSPSVVDAHANHGGTASSGVLNTHYWKVCRAGFTPGVNSIDRALDMLRANTSIRPTVVSCTSGNQNVSAWSTNTSYTWLGRTSCTGIHNSTNNRCSSKTVWLNAPVIRAAPNPVKQWQKTAAHEMGHVGGLGHRYTNTSCMRQGYSPPIYTIYDSHDCGSLNVTY